MPIHTPEVILCPDGNSNAHQGFRDRPHSASKSWTSVTKEGSSALQPRGATPRMPLSVHPIRSCDIKPRYGVCRQVQSNRAGTAISITARI